MFVRVCRGHRVRRWIILGGLKGNIFGLEGTVHLGELNGTNGGGVYPDYFRRRFFALVRVVLSVPELEYFAVRAA